MLLGVKEEAEVKKEEGRQMLALLELIPVGKIAEVPQLQTVENVPIPQTQTVEEFVEIPQLQTVEKVMLLDEPVADTNSDVFHMQI